MFIDIWVFPATSTSFNLFSYGFPILYSSLFSVAELLVLKSGQSASFVIWPKQSNVE